MIDDILARIARLAPDSYVVGGAVRDRLLGQSPDDYDVSVGGGVPALCQRLAKETGARRVVLRWPEGHERLAARSSDGSPIWIDFGSHGSDLEADLGKRDFSVDAMAVPVTGWSEHGIRPHVIDPHGGMGDLGDGVIRETRPGNIAADPVRVLRAVRLALELDFVIAPPTEVAAIEAAPRLAMATPERVRDEVYAIFAHYRAMDGVRLMERVGALSAVFPELDAARGVEQPPNHHYWDVFEHSVQAVGKADAILSSDKRASTPELSSLPWRDEHELYFREIVGDLQSRSTLLRMAALLHDAGKPSTKSIDEDGRTRFFGHSERGAEIADCALTRLRCSRRVIEHVSKMVEEHLRPGQISQGRERPTRRAVYRFQRDLAPVAMDTVFLSLADYLAARGPRLNRADWEGFCGVAGDILNRAFDPPGESKASLLLDGNDIQRHLNLRPGPQLGRLLEQLREAEATGRVQTRQEAIDMLRSEVARPGDRENRP